LAPKSDFCSVLDRVPDSVPRDDGGFQSGRLRGLQAVIMKRGECADLSATGQRRRRRESRARAGSDILRADPTAAAALQPATSAEANNGTLRVKRTVVDAVSGHGIDLLRVRHNDILR
jgi:hypothetical protein